MNQGLPKPVREALARQTAGDAHPSADVLTAFVDQSLPQGESQRVTAHLAQCADCREVVFLASNAVEEPVSKELELPAAAALFRMPHTVEGKRAMASAAPAKASPRGEWRMRWAWAAVGAVLIVAVIFFLDRSESGRRAQMTMAVKGPAPTISQPPPAGAPAPESESQLTTESKFAQEKATAKSPRVQTGAKSLPAGTITLQAHEEHAPAPTATATPAASPPPAVAVLGAAKVPPVETPMRNAFVGGEAPSTAGVVARPQMAMHAVPALRPKWRVTPDGHLERSIIPGSWAPMLADQPIVFHVVSVVGNNVWAGGSGGALFHSSDRGENWSKQPLGGETGTIVSIQFSDALHGIVNTDGGSRWTTSDGGVTWTKE